MWKIIDGREKYMKEYIKRGISSTSFYSINNPNIVSLLRSTLYIFPDERDGQL